MAVVLGCTKDVFDFPEIAGELFIPGQRFTATVANPMTAGAVVVKSKPPASLCA